MVKGLKNNMQKIEKALFSSFDLGDFIAQIEANFGLVRGGYCREYLKVNNPHKTSFYLKSELPVIVWSQHGTFVLKKQD